MHDWLKLPIDASAHGHDIDNLIVVIHWLMAVLFVGWGAFFLYTLVRFRKKANPTADYIGVKSHASSYLEVAVALFEGFLLVGLSIPVWADVWTNYPDEKDAVVIHVVAEQFAWNIHYPGKDGKFGRRDVKLVTAENPLGLDRENADGKDDIAAINNLHIPVGKKILLKLSSKDVIHSLGVPLLRLKQDAIPGQQIPITFTATMTTAQIREMMRDTYPLAAGKIPKQLSLMIAQAEYKAKDGSVILASGDAFTEDAINKLLEAGVTSVDATQDTPAEIACAQLCGLGHYRMRGTVFLDTAEQYEAWLAEEASYLEQ